MMLNPGIVISKSALLRIMYPNGKQAEQKILDVFVCKIRKKIKGAFGIDIIETCWGRGYMVP
jgi:two-component system cell cycle response regulator CtrA